MKWVSQQIQPLKYPPVIKHGNAKAVEYKNPTKANANEFWKETLHEPPIPSSW